jgi:hypothetical protein
MTLKDFDVRSFASQKSKESTQQQVLAALVHALSARTVAQKGALYLAVPLKLSLQNGVRPAAMVGALHVNSCMIGPRPRPSSRVL